MKRIIISIAIYLISINSEAQIAKIRSLNAISVGTPSVVFFIEPVVKSFGKGMDYPGMSTGDLAYSIAYKSVRTSGEILMFPCQPDVFSLKAGIDFKISDKVSSINIDPYLKNYWYGAVHFGYESLFQTNIKGLIFTAGVEIVGYNSVRTYDEYREEKIYAGIAINSGLDFHISRRFFLSTDVHLMFGNRWYDRNIKVENSEFTAEHGNDVVMSIGMPHLISLQLYYVMKEFKK